MYVHRVCVYIGCVCMGMHVHGVYVYINLCRMVYVFTGYVFMQDVLYVVYVCSWGVCSEFACAIGISVHEVRINGCVCMG